jgi:uncharacterized repeat protein (TIGR03803 family)
MVAPLAWAQTEGITTLYRFKGKPTDGSSPVGIISAGNLIYGTTQFGGSFGAGTVFSLTLPASAGDPVTEQVLYDLPSTAPDDDFSSPVVLGPGGVLYGTTYTGGLYHGGTAYSLTPPTSPGGAWTQEVLWNFSFVGGNAQNPLTGVVVGSGGVLYGASSAGGANADGAIFSLTPPLPRETPGPKRCSTALAAVK